MTTATTTGLDAARIVAAWLEGNEANGAAPTSNPYPHGPVRDAWQHGFDDQPLPGFYDDEPTRTFAPVIPTPGRHAFGQVRDELTVEQILARFGRAGVPAHRRAAGQR